ncbi:ABC transporter permease [Ktedonosporobacter rubrisoli]|uniref:ABC transporter permease n=2 Tax=Ktedonosporobacter rubrisoli TaxID=2509675 RepID=A0A4V0Z0M1_KTERU|nr:ABC transporter permease [Ktedonosporobacter rubrisoli]
MPQGKPAKQRTHWHSLWLIVARCLLLALILLIWQLVSGRWVDPLFLSSPLEVAGQLLSWTADGTLWFHTVITLQETVLGLVFGCVSGILVGFLLGLSPQLSSVLDPFITAIYSIPKVALAPLFILWFGIDVQMKVILAAVTVFFLVFFITLAGVREVDQDLVDAVRLMGGNQREIIWKVIVPSTLSAVLTGVHMAIPYALIGAVVGELIVSNRGIGFLIQDSASAFHTSGVFAALLVLTVIASLLNALVHLVERKTSRWKADLRLGRKGLP